MAINQTTTTEVGFNLDAFLVDVVLYRQLEFGEHTCMITGVDTEKSKEDKIVLDAIIDGEMAYQLRCSKGQLGFQLGAIADQLKLKSCHAGTVLNSIYGKELKAWYHLNKNGFKNLDFRQPVVEAPAKPKLDEEV